MPDNLNDNLDLFKDYHNLQYNRIEKLETQKFNFSNLILTLSTGALTFGYTNSSQAIGNGIQLICIPLLLIVGNFIAIIYLYKTRYFIKIHQKRAKEARLKYAKDLEQINNKVGKVNSNHDIFNRNYLQVFIHALFILIGKSIIIYCVMRLCLNCFDC